MLDSSFRVLNRNLSIARIRQEDIRHLQEELNRLLSSVNNTKRALELATRIADISCGITERSQSRNNLGSAYFNLQKYDIAHKTWLKAYESAEKVAEKYGENEILYNVLKNLMISFAMRKEFSRMEEIVEQVESHFHGQPERLGAICYSVAMAEYDRNQLGVAREKLYESLSHFVQTGDKKSIGVAQSNVAYIEYKLKNYKKAKEHYEDAIENLSEHAYWCLVASKDYVKTLIKLGEIYIAETVIQESIKRLNSYEYADLEGKFHLLLSRARNDIGAAENLLIQNKFGKTIQQLVCKFLMNHFSKVGDAVSLLKYYKISEGLMINHGDILEEDAL